MSFASLISGIGGQRRSDQFVITMGSTEVRIQGDDRSVTVTVEPDSAFYNQLDSNNERTHVILKHGGFESKTLGVEIGQSIRFENVPTATEAPALVDAILKVIRYDERLTAMVNDLAQPRDGLDIDVDYEALRIKSALGRLSLMPFHEQISLEVTGFTEYFQPDGALVVGGERFEGAWDAEGAMLFLVNFPEREEFVRRLVLALRAQ